jgi:hypothetical protein
VESVFLHPYFNINKYMFQGCKRFCTLGYILHPWLVHQKQQVKKIAVLPIPKGAKSAGFSRARADYITDHNRGETSDAANYNEQGAGAGMGSRPDKTRSFAA